MTHEKNMIEFVIEQKKLLKKRAGKTTNNSWRIQHSVDCEHQADFLDSQPQIGDFVPTNEKGEVMEKPNKPLGFDKWIKGDAVSNGIACVVYNVSINQFQQALSRVLWTEWEIDWWNLIEARVIHEDGQFVEFDKHGATKTYNDLITSGIKLERIMKK